MIVAHPLALQRLFLLRDTNSNRDIQENARFTLQLLGYRQADPSGAYTQMLTQLNALGFGRGHADLAIRALAQPTAPAVPTVAAAAGNGNGSGFGALAASALSSAKNLFAGGGGGAGGSNTAGVSGQSNAAGAAANAHAKEASALLSMAHDPQVQSIPMDVASVEKLANWLIEHPRTHAARTRDCSTEY